MWLPYYLVAVGPGLLLALAEALLIVQSCEAGLCISKRIRARRMLGYLDI